MLLDDDTLILPNDGFLSQFGKLEKGSLLTCATRKYLSLKSNFETFFDALSLENWQVGEKVSSFFPKNSRRELDLYTSEITFATNFGIIDRRSFDDIRGFDENLNGWGYEDVDFMNRVVRQGSISSCRETVTAIHVDHLVTPEQGDEAYGNYSRFRAKCQTDPDLPRFSAVFYGVAMGFLKTIHRSCPPSVETILTSLKSIPHFFNNPQDANFAAEEIARLTHEIDLLAIAVYGSAASKTEGYRDIDLCLIAGFCTEQFIVFDLPSGISVEIHLAPLFTICRQIGAIPYLGDNACPVWLKWKHLKYVYDYEHLVSRYVGSCMAGHPEAIPTMMAFYTGLAWVFLNKPQTADQLILGRYFTILAQLNGSSAPPRELCLDTERARVWFTEICRSLSPKYLAFLQELGEPHSKVLIYPPNFFGDRILKGQEV